MTIEEIFVLVLVPVILAFIGWLSSKALKRDPEAASISDLWKRTESLQSMNDELVSKVNELIEDRAKQNRALTILGDGFDGAVKVIERITIDGQAPLITRFEQAAINAARELRNGDDLNWPTIQPLSKKENPV